MSFRPASFGCLCGGVAFTICVGLWNVQAADSSRRNGQPIEFSDPRSDTLITNVIQLGEEAKGTRHLEANSPESEPLTLPRSSLNAILPPPVAVSGVIINKRGKDAFDALNNSEFNTPEEAMREMLVNELLKLPGYEPNRQTKDQRRQPAPSIESVYERMLVGGAETANPWRYYDLFGSRRTAEERHGSSALEEPKSPWGDDGLTLKNYADSALNSRLSRPDTGPKSLSDLFGLDADNRPNEMSPEAIRAKEAQENQLKRFQDLLNGIYDIQPTATAENSSPAANPWESSTVVFPSAPEQPNPWAKAQGAINPNLLPPSAPAVQVPSSLSPAPYTPPPKTPPPKPLFSVPQRAF